MKLSQIGAACGILLFAPFGTSNATPVAPEFYDYYSATTLILGQSPDQQQTNALCGTVLPISCAASAIYTGAFSAGTAEGTVEVTGGAAPKITARVAVSDSVANAQATLAYYFQIIPTAVFAGVEGGAGSDISATISGFMGVGPQSPSGVQAGIATYSSASISLYSSDPHVTAPMFTQELSFLTTRAATDSSYSYNTGLTVGLWYPVVMSVNATASDSIGASETYALVDPTITLEGPDAGDYTVIYSPGLVDAVDDTSVPEPSSWSIMILGFAGLGLALHRRVRARTERLHTAT